MYMNAFLMLTYRLPLNFFHNTPQAEYKNPNECPLTRIPSEHFNIVDDIPLDSMHLIYLGQFIF